MRLLQLAFVVLVFVSCDEIDGIMEIFKRFSLTDEDGKKWTFATGYYGADFSYDRGDREVEIEIDDLDDGDDVDFKFHVPHMDQIDFSSDYIELDVGEHASGQGVGLQSTIERKYSVSNLYRYDYTNDYCYDEYSANYYPYAVYDIVETRVYVDGVLYRNENHLADFEASTCVKRTRVQYCVDCYGNIHHRCSYDRTFFCE